MGKFKSKDKGNRREREMAGELEKWWAKVEPAANFVRTPLSGGWQGHSTQGKRIRAGFDACGDIMTTANKFPFTVEVKAREGWSVARLFAGKPTAPWQWWVSCQSDAHDQGGEPMLCMRKNRQPWLIMVTAKYHAKLKGRIQTPDVVFPRELLLANEVVYGQELPVLYLRSTFFKMSPRVFAKDV